jgi:hypothetical protein
MVKSMTPLGDHHVDTAEEIFARQRNAVEHMTGISDKLRREMPKEQYSALLDMMSAAGGHRDALDIGKMLDEILAAKSLPPMAPGDGRSRNFEAAIHSRLSVLSSDKHDFDMLKVYRTRDAGKFYIFVVVKDKWVVLEDEELFPSDKLISALRCLTL